MFVAGIKDELENGRAGTLIKSLDLLEETLGRDLKLEFPQVVAIGDENSGKSALLERITMLPFFPMQQGRCTRMPVKLRMIHLSPNDLELFGKENGIHSVSMDQVFVKFNGKITSDFQEIEQAVSYYMKSIKVSLLEHELTIELFGNQVPNLTLIDLPGLVGATRPDEPASLCEDSRQLAEKYIKEAHTLILAVIHGRHRPRNSQVLALIENNKKEAETIGVLTNSDHASDPHRYVHCPYQELMDLLDGISATKTHLPNGYVAVKNRSSREKEDLHSVASSEAAWFNTNLPGYREKGKAGGDSLIKKIVNKMCEHVSSNWVPIAENRIQELRARAKMELDSLGEDFMCGDPQNNLKRLTEKTRSLLKQDFSNSKIFGTQSFANELVQQIFEKLQDSHSSSTYDEFVAALNRVTIRKQRKELIPKILQLSQQVILERIAKCLQENTGLPIRLERFEQWIHDVVSSFHNLLESLHQPAKEKMEKSLDFYELHEVLTKTTSVSTELGRLFANTITDIFVIGVYEVLSSGTWEKSMISRSTNSIRKWLTEGSSWSMKRVALETQIQKLDTSSQIIQTLSEPKLINNNNEDTKQCKVCFSNAIDTVIVPCGHMCICLVCSKKIQNKCPICNQKVDLIVKTFAT